MNFTEQELLDLLMALDWAEREQPAIFQHNDLKQIRRKLEPFRIIVEQEKLIVRKRARKVYRKEHPGSYYGRKEQYEYEKAARQQLRMIRNEGWTLYGKDKDSDRVKYGEEPTLELVDLLDAIKRAVDTRRPYWPQEHIHAIAERADVIRPLIDTRTREEKDLDAEEEWLQDEVAQYEFDAAWDAFEADMRRKGRIAIFSGVKEDWDSEEDPDYEPEERD